MNNRLEELRQRFNDEAVKRVAAEKANKFKDFHASQEEYLRAKVQEYKEICIELFDLLSEEMAN